MTCRQFLPLLLAERDRTLSASEQEQLSQHVAACAGCRQLRGRWGETVETWRAATATAPVPSVDTLWRDVRAQRGRATSTASAAGRRGLGWFSWAGVPLAAAAAVAVVLAMAPEPEAAAPARAIFVEPGDSRASTVVFVDEPSGWLIVWAAPPAG